MVLSLLSVSLSGGLTFSEPVLVPNGGSCGEINCNATISNPIVAAMHSPSAVVPIASWSSTPPAVGDQWQLAGALSFIAAAAGVRQITFQVGQVVA